MVSRDGTHADAPHAMEADRKGTDAMDRLITELEGLAVVSEPTAAPLTPEALATGLQEGKYRHVVVMAGAGISVAAGIPDFRTPGSGLFDNLQKYNLRRPEDVFDISYFKNISPLPFYQLAKEISPGR